MFIYELQLCVNCQVVYEQVIKTLTRFFRIANEYPFVTSNAYLK